MAQFDQWQEFWDKYLLDRYGKEVVSSEDDLYFQVARTVNKRPIEKAIFDGIVAQIINDLDLTGSDVLVDFCCGNGLFTYELRDHAAKIIGVDFSQNIIDTANKFKSAPNITYCLGSVVTYLKDFKEKWPQVTPAKYLMNDSLAYFTPKDLEAMLVQIKDNSRDFKFLLRGAPNDELKWNYYNTEERKAVYLANIAKGDLTNDGLGNWWLKDDILRVCNKLNLACEIRNQQLPVSDYRMDIIITS